MNLEDIKKFLDENKGQEEVSAYLQGFKKFGVDEVQKFVSENEEARKWFDSEKDKHFSKGLDTWRTNNLEKIISEEIKKRNPDKTPEQLELDKLRADLEKMQNEKVRETLKNKALTVAGDKKIPTSLIDFFIGQDEEGTLANLGQFETAMNEYVKSQVEDRLKGSYTPPGGGNPSVITMDQLKNMSTEEIAKLDPKLLDDLLKG
ncbi:DUF4355 domain-containing protein [Fictibacillus phosphorivorans]|uniref:DUF4355 domain-containing protein n=1 Tax=Fictibacillus phosphorivorans TaxID=1221500 RepID=UPI0011AB211B|nr:DUF4355 domain-containing protein [Fictibacillus phosphorivorans]